MAELLVYVRYCFGDKLLEDILFCQALTQTTTGNDIFNMLNNFLETEDLKWSNRVGVCTDGAASMTGDKKGLKA